MTGLKLLGLAALAGVSSAPAPSFAGPLSAEAVAHAIAARLPRTEVTKVDCAKVPGICEVQAGTNIFYVDGSARYLIVGRLYDMETRQDLTAARLLEVNPDLLLGGAASARDGNADTALVANGHAQGPQAASSGMAQKVSLAGLPASGGVEWGGTGPSVTVFSDFHCGYCRMLHQALKAIGAHVTERPISVLGTRAISETVICAEDKAQAVEKAYTDQDLGTQKGSGRACDTSGLDANERFARDHGFTGTPVIVRSDGAVVLGFRPREFLEAWLKGGA